MEGGRGKRGERKKKEREGKEHFLMFKFYYYLMKKLMQIRNFLNSEL